MPLPRDRYPDPDNTLSNYKQLRIERHRVGVISDQRDEAEFQLDKARAWAIRYKKLYEKSRKQYYMWVAFSNQNKKRAEKAERERDELIADVETETYWFQEAVKRAHAAEKKLDDITYQMEVYQKEVSAQIDNNVATEQKLQAMKESRAHWRDSFERESREKVRAEREKLLLLEALKGIADSIGKNVLNAMRIGQPKPPSPR